MKKLKKLWMRRPTLSMPKARTWALLTMLLFVSGIAYAGWALRGQAFVVTVFKQGDNTEQVLMSTIELGELAKELKLRGERIEGLEGVVENLQKKIEKYEKLGMVCS